MNYEVIREQESKLIRLRWRFWVNGTRVILDKFYRETRPSTRHKYRWEICDCYDRTDRRNSGIPAHAVPQSKDVRFDVLRQITLDLRVVIHDGRDVEAPFAPDWEPVPMPPLRWEPAPNGGKDECFVDIDGLGRYLVIRRQKGGREFHALLNGMPTAYYGSVDQVKQAVARVVAQRAVVEGK